MIAEHLRVGLVVERRRQDGPWGAVVWRPTTVFAVPPDVAPWTALGGTAQVARYYAGEADLHLYATETARYRDNLASGEPKLWVVLRRRDDPPEIAPPEIALVTADPTEGEASTEAGDNVVEPVAMPPELARYLEAFVTAHHVERPFIKRQRDRAGAGGPSGPNGRKSDDTGSR